MSGVNFAEFANKVGLEELATLSRDDVPEFAMAAVTGLCDSDIYVGHEQYTGKQAELYGELNYGEGRVARAVLKAAIEAGPAPGVVHDFQDFAAEFFADPTSPFAAIDAHSGIQVGMGEIVIDNRPFSLPRIPTLVMDLSACLSSRGYLTDQMRFAQHRQQPFTYLGIMRTHFTNRVFMDTYDNKNEPGIAELMINEKLYIGREDGATSALTEFIEASKTYHAPLEIADVIISAGAHQHATREDAKFGITNAHKLLKAGGKLVVRSQAQPPDGELGTEEIVSWAVEAGFDRRGIIRHTTDVESPGSIVTGHTGPIETAVLTK